MNENQEIRIGEGKARVTILKTLSGRFVAGNSDGQVRIITPQEVDAIRRLKEVELSEEIVEKEMPADIEGILVNVEKGEGDARVSGRVGINVIHMVDVGCSAAYDPINGIWYVDRMVKYSKKQKRMATG